MHEVRRPLVGIAICCFGGMLLGEATDELYQLIFPLTVCLWCMALFYKNRSFNLYVWITIFLVGLLHYSSVSMRQSTTGVQNPLEACIEPDSSYSGIVINEPKFMPFQASSRGVWRFELDLRACDCKKETLLNQRVHVRVYGWGNEEMPYIWEHVTMEGRVEKDTWQHVEKWELNVRSIDFIERAPKTIWLRVAEQLRNLRAYALTTLSAEEEQYQDHAAIQRAVIIGDREGVPYELRDLFRHTGCMHVFAISGLHVGFLLIIASILVRLMGISLPHHGWILIPILIVYVYLTGMRASVLRASLMAAGYLIAIHFREKPDLANIIALSALLLLIWNPLYSSDAGFLLSYVIVIFILLAFARCSNQFRRISGFWFHLLSLCLSTLIATLFSVPLSLYLFGSGSMVGLLANLFVIPMLFLVVFGSWMSLLILPFSSIFNQASYTCIEFILMGLRGLRKLPVGLWEVEDVSLGGVLLWYGGGLYLLIWARRRKELLKGALLMGVALLLMGDFF